MKSSIWKVFVFLVSLAPFAVPAQTVKTKPDDGFVVESKAKPFPLSEVTLEANSPFYHARIKNLRYLLLLEPNRLLHRFHLNAHLPVKDSVYKGWESEGLSGHTLGHYLSAASMMYASTKNDTLKERISYILNELDRCQKAKETGYIGAIPNEDTIFAKVKRGDIRTSGFDLNGGWSPWYTVHKLLAGLLDAYQYTANTRALQLAKGMGDWSYATINHLPDSSLQRMLKCEYGGMNEALAQLYVFTGNRKYLDLSYKFFDNFVMEPLSRRIDPLPGKHSNTNVPKAIGSALQYELTGNKRDSTIASFFWETMTGKHSYVIGGNSNYEYCGEEGKLNDRLSDNTCETCNTYNMLKLTKHLNSWAPSSIYMDYYERALYNHILASQNPETGMMCYFVPLRMGTRKQFSDSFNTFTCCVGSGIENHSKYQEQIYSHDDAGTIWVNLFIPSTLHWKEKGLTMTLSTAFPDQDIVSLQFAQKGKLALNIKIRKPFWQTGDPVVRVNGRPYVAKVDHSGYYTISGTFSQADKIVITTAMHLYTESMPDNADRIAFKYGPLVLAGVLGDKMPDPVYGTPVLLTSLRDPQKLVQQKPGNTLAFTTVGTGKPFDVTLKPFYKVYDEYYSVYFDYFTEADWSNKQKEYEDEKRREKELEAKTIDNFRIGEMQPERDHKLVASERSYVDDAIGRKGREARTGHYFQFEMKVDPESRNELVLTYIGDDKDRKFDILVDGTKVATEEWKGGKTGKFYDLTYTIPSTLTAGKTTVIIRIEANYGKTAGRVFGVRMTR
jgi:DUF1680 family protein